MPSGRRVPFPLLLGALILICFVLPRWFYGVRLAMMELRYGGIIFVLCLLLVWALARAPGPRK